MKTYELNDALFEAARRADKDTVSALQKQGVDALDAFAACEFDPNGECDQVTLDLLINVEPNERKNRQFLTVAQELSKSIWPKRRDTARKIYLALGIPVPALPSV